MGTAKVIYQWDNEQKIKAPKKILYQIAEEISKGKAYGSIMYCFDGISDLSGWWINTNKIM